MNVFRLMSSLSVVMWHCLFCKHFTFTFLKWIFYHFISHRFCLSLSFSIPLFWILSKFYWPCHPHALPSPHYICLFWTIYLWLLHVFVAVLWLLFLLFIIYVFSVNLLRFNIANFARSYRFLLFYVFTSICHILFLYLISWNGCKF